MKSLRMKFKLKGPQKVFLYLAIQIFNFSTKLLPRILAIETTPKGF